MGESVKAVIRNYAALLTIISQDAELGNPTAIGLLQQLTSYLYGALFHLAADVLTAVNKLSKTLQKTDVCFAHVSTGVRKLQYNIFGIIYFHNF